MPGVWEGLSWKYVSKSKASGSTLYGLAVAMTVESRFIVDVTIFLPEDSNAFL